MKKWLVFASCLFLVGYIGAAEEYEIEESDCEETDFCPMEEEDQEEISYRCPNRQCHRYYEYEDRDTDASWPGKMENSFMEELMR